MKDENLGRDEKKHVTKKKGGCGEEIQAICGRKDARMDQEKCEKSVCAKRTYVKMIM